MLKDKEKLTILEVKRSRFLCHACGATIFAKIDLVDDHYQLTNELKHAILMELFENQSFKLINKKNFVSDGMIARILRESTKDYQPNPTYLPAIFWMNSNL